MRPGQATAILAPIALLCGCATGPQAETRQDMGFVWGCWVQKAGPDRKIEAFLRLLLNRDGEPDLVFEGEINAIADHPTTQQGLSFARDGSSATYWFTVSWQSRDSDAVVLPFGAAFHFDRETRPAAHAQSGRHRAVFRNVENSDRTLVVEATADRLKITKLNREDDPPVKVLFDGERDGCD